MKLPFSPSCKPTEHPTPRVGVLNIDWLAFSVRLLETSTERDAHAFIFRPVSDCKVFELPGTNIYKRRLMVFNNEGRKLLTLLCQPYSRAINYLSAFVEVANEWLYLGFSWVMDLLNDLHPCEFLCMSRLDICVDWELHPDQQQLIQDLCTNKAYIQGKRDGSAFYSYTIEDKVERIPRCLSWGSKHSNIKWKVYNKSAEVFEMQPNGVKICHKPYIVAQWEDVAFNVENVWRIEVSINPMHKFEWHGQRVTFHDVLHTFLPMDLFIGLYQTRFVIRNNEGHKDRSNDKRRHLLGDFGATDRLKQWINPNPHDLPIIEFAASLNAAMTQLQKPEVQANKQIFEAWHHVAEETIINGRLQGYFQKAYGYEFKHMKEKILLDVQ